MTSRSSQSLFSPTDRAAAEAIAELTYCNPFSPRRIELEQIALGDAFHPTPAIWSLTEPGELDQRPNVALLEERVVGLVTRARGALGGRGVAGLSERDRALYEDLGFYLLYHRYYEKLSTFSREAPAHAVLGGESLGGGAGRTVRFYDAFAAEYADLGLRGHTPEHVFACYFQIRRAFPNILGSLIGRSRPAGQLREAVWESIFTHDLRRYARGLHARMGDMATLILGPSGTGKELVARAIGRSRYIPFDPVKKRFVAEASRSFLPVNLSALSPTLIESELFGHRRGAFTGAVEDRIGWLETCPDLGTVFLDEVGELDPAIQVKLLRVLQERSFQRLGGTHTLPFQGKIIAATHRDLNAAITAGTFREDFYYRLCSDVIRTPSLREQFDDAPDDLRRMVGFILLRLEETDPEARLLVTERLRACVAEDYAWPGNFRELEQCVRNILIRGTYVPRKGAESLTGLATDLDAVLRRIDLSADQLLDRYCAATHARVGSYLQAAERLGLDRRTVRLRAHRVRAENPGA